jgi:uncharacterized surface protein with fasciclin (FAS1) repeats
LLKRRMLAPIVAACGIFLLIGAAPKPSRNIAEVASSDMEFRTLVKALKAADMLDTLKGSGPYTVFAPTDAAFAKIPKHDLDALMKDKARLKHVLSFHVLRGDLESSQLSTRGSVMSLDGDTLSVHGSGDNIRVNDAKVVKANIGASNGVIHAIDTVLMPK